MRALHVSTGTAHPSGAAATRRSAADSSRAARGGLVDVVAVGLVHRDHVGELEHALLDALQLVAGAGQREQQEGVDHAGDGVLGLADADRLDEHDVVAGRLQHDDRLAGRAGPPRRACRALGDGRTNACSVDGQPGHPGLVAEDRAAGAARRRVDGQHRDPVPGRRQLACRAPR